MLLFVFFRFIVLMKVTHYILFFKQKNIWAKSYSLHFVSTIFFKHMFKQKFIAWHLNESCLCALLCFFRCIEIFEKSLCVFCEQNILIKTMIIVINCADNLNYYTTNLFKTDLRENMIQIYDVTITTSQGCNNFQLYHLGKKLEIITRLWHVIM